MSSTTITEREALIRQKVLAGLTRKQAETSVTAQEEHDANLEKQSKAAAKKKPAAGESEGEGENKPESTKPPTAAEKKAAEKAAKETANAEQK